MIASSTDVLIVGAGPTGLVLALFLSKLGVSVRLVDKAAEPGTTSRALAIQARTLELYRSIDLSDDVVRKGLVLGAVNLWADGKQSAHIELDTMGRGLSPFPFAVIFPQDEHERLLIDRLASMGVTVERCTEIVGIERGESGAVATLRSANGEISRCEASYVAGCDGARSIVRSAIQAEFPGGTYQHLFYVADIAARGAIMNREIHIMLDDAGFLGLFPLAGEGRARLIGTVQNEDQDADAKLSFRDVDRTPVARAGLEVINVNWFSTYRVHHRVADFFRRGHVFLLGDAAHIHSPVGGQGMNTGIGDAFNLAWKLASVLAGRANRDLLDTYEPERIAFARRLVKTTDRVFQAASSPSDFASVMRTQVLPRVVSRIARASLGRRLFFRALSQTGIHYRDSAWSQGHAGSIHAGDRLPWVSPTHVGGKDNHTPLRSLDWQAQVYAEPSTDLTVLCTKHKIDLVTFPFEEATKQAGIQEDQVYLVRPDGYIGLVARRPEAPARIEDYVAAHGITTRH